MDTEWGCRESRSYCKTLRDESEKSTNEQLHLRMLMTPSGHRAGLLDVLALKKTFKHACLLLLFPSRSNTDIH